MSTGRLVKVPVRVLPLAPVNGVLDYSRNTVRGGLPALGPRRESKVNPGPDVDSRKTPRD